MNDIIIFSSYGDLHGAAVDWALKEMGASPKLWYGEEFPTRQTASLRIGRQGLQKLSLREDEHELMALHRAKTVWNRRPANPVMSSQLHAADKPAAMDECLRFVGAIKAQLQESAFWVNPAQPALRANHKPLQLALAAECGLTIPDSLFSNDPDEIATFFHQHGGNIIYKTFIQPHWQNDEQEQTFTFFTSKFPESALQRTFSLRNVPGIYQPTIEKAYEVRLTMMGNQFFPVKIDSQSNPKSTLDWRQDLTLKCKHEPCEVPSEVLNACRQLMAKLGLVFGCIDLIVTPEGEHVFLEVNQMGQFLWLEDIVPEFAMLETFCRFLISADAGFEMKTQPVPALSFAAFRQSDAFATYKLESETTRPWPNLATRE